MRYKPRQKIGTSRVGSFTTFATREAHLHTTLLLAKTLFRERRSVSILAGPNGGQGKAAGTKIPSVASHLPPHYHFPRKEKLMFRPSCKIGLFLAIIGSLAISSGCRNLTGPQWFNPGTMQQQQLRAMSYDPYPDNNLGPAMVGVRPREFQKPAAEAPKIQPHAFWGS